MNEAYTYGGNGSLERTEYNKPTGESFRQYIEMVNVELEAYLNLEKTPPGVKDTTWHDVDMSNRTFTFSYVADNAKIFYDTKEGTILLEGNLNPDFTVVSIEHRLYSKSVLQEEYIVKIDRNQPGTTGDFSNHYSFSRFAGGAWVAEVEHNDVNPDAQQGKFYSRPMTPYDFDEFFKDTAQMSIQLKSLLVQ